jgi:hypothetical protein
VLNIGDVCGYLTVRGILMSKGSRAFLVFFVTVVVLLVATRLFVESGIVRPSGIIRLFSRTTVHWYGWVGLVLLVISRSYSGLKMLFPRNIRVWLYVHCIFGLLSLLVIGVHLFGRVASVRPSHFWSFFTYSLMLVIVIGGIVGRFGVRVPFLWESWRRLHIYLTVLFIVTLAMHILEKLWLI